MEQAEPVASVRQTHYDGHRPGSWADAFKKQEASEPHADMWPFSEAEGNLSQCSFPDLFHCSLWLGIAALITEWISKDDLRTQQRLRWRDYKNKQPEKIVLQQ